MNPPADHLLPAHLDRWAYIIEATRDLSQIAGTGAPSSLNEPNYGVMSWPRLQVPLPAPYLTNVQNWLLVATTLRVQREFLS